MFFYFYFYFIYLFFYNLSFIYLPPQKKEKISNNINNVLALRMNTRFVELLKSPSPILQVN